MYNIEFNNKKSSEVGLMIRKRPDIPAPQEDYTETKIPGRDGALCEMDGTYQDIIIPIEFNYITEPNTWQAIFRNAKQWLFSKESSRLRFDDDAEFYYKVKRVVIQDNARLYRRVGNFIASFVCEPFQYLLDGDREYGLADVLYNPYFISHPTYIIKGEGDCELQVNGNTMQISVGQEIVIDTERMLAYKADTLLNISLTGDYQDLYLLPGENEISITDGFEVAVIPHWRCL